MPRCPEEWPTSATTEITGQGKAGQPVSAGRGNVLSMAISHEILPAGLAAALRRPAGARFHRIALQVNPYGYLVQNSKPNPYQNESQYNEAIVSACVKNGIEAIAVADHFEIETSEGLAAAARAAGIVVFPGFEAVSKEGVHLLCVFDPARPWREIERIIGQCGVHNTGHASPLGDLDTEELLAKARDWQAVIVAAHVTSAKGGLLRKLTGQSRVRVWRSNDLQAIAIPGAVADLPDADRAIVSCRGEYRREQPIAVLNAGDVCGPEDLAKTGSWSWIKMTDLTLDGLHQAVLDPSSRIRLPSDPVPEEHTEFVALAWQGGFLDGSAIHFSENLNVLVGGRGAGKTTIIESLRYVLSIEPLGDEARRLHDGIVRGVLQSGTRVSLLARTRTPAESWYLIERTVPNPPIVRDAAGNVIDAQPLEILPGIEIYGQREISELTKNPERLTRLLDRFVRRDDAQAGRKAAIQRELARTRREITEARAELAAIGDRLASLPGLEDTLSRYREAGVEERLREQSLLVREERVLDTASERIASVRNTLAAFARDLSIDRAFISARAISELPAMELLATIDPAFAEFNDAVTAAAESLRAQADAVEGVIEDARAHWRVRQAEVMAAYERILRDLQRERVDGDEFIRLRRRLEELQPLRHREQLVEQAITEFRQRRRNLLAEWEDLRTAEYQALQKAARKVSKALERRIQVSVTLSGDREPLAELLRRRIGGRFSEAVDALRRAPDLSLRELVAAARSGPEALVTKYKLPAGQADKLSNAADDVLMEIEELELPPTTQIELNVAPDGQPAQWQPLGALSTGQKATAVLLLLLHESAAPLVVDQPEDDLDNRFITEGIVPRMREEKRRRQFVFSTHNANIPVLGDAELILGLQATGEGDDRGHADIPQGNAGSIDSASVRKLVEEILEGGREAFEMRRRKYGF